MYNDVSPYFRFNFNDKYMAQQLMKREETPEAIKYFSENCDKLTHYGYWFLLSTLWVSYTGFSDIELWKKLFSSDRPQRLKSIMKPSEVKEFEYLPYFITVYRAKRPEEKQWFEMIVNGEKKEEYREIKPYYDKRLGHLTEGTGKVTTIILRNGYRHNSPAVKCKCTVEIGEGKKEWGADPDINYYIIKIIEILEVKKHV